MAQREDILATLHDGRTIAKGSSTTVFDTGGDYAITVTINTHRVTEKVIQYNLTLDPECYPGEILNCVITGNVVGFTLYGLDEGTTLTVEVVAIGI
jgi:hypothetical protein